MQEYCTLYIFSEVPFERNKNPIIEDISGLYGIVGNFANSLTIAYSSNKFQLPKMTLTQDLVVEANQGLVYSKNTPNNSTPRYVMYVVKVADTGTKKFRYYYYYVDKVEWNAMSSVRLKLTMDTLNTYKNLFVFSNRTHITRMHKDRFLIPSNPVTEGGVTFYKATGNVDYVSEGYTFQLVHTGQSYIEDTNENNVDYAILYRAGQEASNGNLSIYVASSVASTFSNIVSSILLDRTEFESICQDLGIEYGGCIHFFFTGNDNYGVTFTEVDSGNNSHSVTLSTGYIGIEFEYTRAVSGRKIHIRNYTAAGSVTEDYDSAVSLTIGSGCYFARMRYSLNSFIDLPSTLAPMKIGEIQAIGSTYTFLTKTGSHNINAYTSINLIDPLNVKLIHIPYSINTTGMLDYDSHLELYRVNKTTDFINDTPKKTITSASDHPLVKLFFKFNLTTSQMKAYLRDDDFEFKIYHSDFDYMKISYDTSSIIVKLEEYNVYYTKNLWNLNKVLQFDFSVTLNLGSTCIFMFKDLTPYWSKEDYPNVLISFRNNEGMLLSSSYIEYLKNGYNYDQKNKDISLRQNVLSGVLGSASIIAGIVGSMTGAGAGAGIGAITSGAGMLTSIFTSNASKEMNIAEKLHQAELQGIGVKGVSDFDIFKTYSRNKLRYDHYHVTDEVEKMLYQLFYLYGYKCDIYDSPDNYNTSRLWWNFIQADVDFDSEIVGGIDVDIASDIVNKFKEGVTYFHNVDDNYDFKQEMENWEMNVYNTVLSHE